VSNQPPGNRPGAESRNRQSLENTSPPMIDSKNYGLFSYIGRLIWLVTVVGIIWGSYYGYERAISFSIGDVLTSVFTYGIFGGLIGFFSIILAAVVFMLVWPIILVVFIVVIIIWLGSIISWLAQLYS
jgi:hypothetical protein